MTCAADVLELFDLAPEKRKETSVGDAAQALLERLRSGALTADELVRASGLEPGEAAAALVELELARRVEIEDGVYRPAI